MTEKLRIILVGGKPKHLPGSELARRFDIVRHIHDVENPPNTLPTRADYVFLLASQVNAPVARAFIHRSRVPVIRFPNSGWKAMERVLVSNHITSY